MATVQLRSINPIILYLGLSLVSAAALAADSVESTNSPRESIRQSLFKDSLSAWTCKVLRPKAGEVAAIDKSLAEFTDQVLTALRTKKLEQLKPLFHPRLKMTDAKVADIGGMIEHTYVEPIDYSIDRMWAMNVPEGHPKSIEDCEGGDLRLTPHYGYPLQFGVYLQMQAQNELGKVYFSIVPLKSKWYIGAWHFQQATHVGRNGSDWAEQAAAAQRKGANVAAYLEYDIARKLYDGGAFIDFKIKDQISSAQLALYTPESLLKAMQAKFKSSPLVYVDSIFAPDGVGMLFRLKIDHDTATTTLREDCIKLGKSWYEDANISGYLGGIKCSYVSGPESPVYEGKLGGMMFTKSEVLAPRPKS